MPHQQQSISLAEYRQLVGLEPTAKTKQRKQGKPADLEGALALQLRVADFPAPARELVFHPQRKWRFDFAWPDQMVACEIEGITHDGGRHQRVDGFEKDLEKYEAAMLLGWTVYRVSGNMVKKGKALRTLSALLECEHLLNQ